MFLQETLDNVIGKLMQYILLTDLYQKNRFRFNNFSATAATLPSLILSVTFLSKVELDFSNIIGKYKEVLCHW